MAPRRLRLIGALCALAPLAATSAPAAPSVVEAVPPSAAEALFLEPLALLEPAMDGLSSALGGGFALSFSQVAALPNLVLQEQVRGAPGALGLNPAGGLGIFRLDGFEGAIGVVAVSDEPKAMDALVRKLREDGAELIGSSRAGVELQEPDEAPVLAFCHRRFLYLVMPDDLIAYRSNEAIADAIRASAPTGLGGTPLWHQLSSRVDRRGSVVFFKRRPLAYAGDLLAVLMAVRPLPDRLEVSGFAATARPVKAGGAAPWRDLIRHAPGSPAVVVSSHVGPELLGALLLGDPSSDAPWLPPWLELGDEAAALAAAMGGGLDALAYTRAGVARVEGESWDEDGAVLWEASLREASEAAGIIERRFRQRGAYPDGAPWRLRIRGGALSGALGPRPSGPPRDLLAELSARFGGGAFGPGHLSVYLDLPMLRESFLDAAELAPSLLPRGQYLFFDAAAAPGGLVLRGELSLEPESGAGAGSEPVGRR